LGLGGSSSVFVNLAAVTENISNVGNSYTVNYTTPLAAAKACERLQFGHWIQSSSQATNAQRSGQVLYSREKAMTDFALSRLSTLPVTVARLGLIYCKTDGLVGQTEGKGLNLIDLSLLPWTPIMGNGLAPLQPHEVTDASDRLAYLAVTHPNERPPSSSSLSSSSFSCIENESVDSQGYNCVYDDEQKAATISSPSVSSLYRQYDAVGPETLTILELLKRFATYQGNNSFRPVFIGYNNMDKVLKIKSLGNMNRQFLSLLRSEQESNRPILGNHTTWESLLGPECQLSTLDKSFAHRWNDDRSRKQETVSVRTFPYWTTLKWILANPGVIQPGVMLSFEIIESFIRSVVFPSVSSTTSSKTPTVSELPFHHHRHHHVNLHQSVTTLAVTEEATATRIDNENISYENKKTSESNTATHDAEQYLSLPTSSSSSIENEGVVTILVNSPDNDDYNNDFNDDNNSNSCDDKKSDDINPNFTLFPSISLASTSSSSFTTPDVITVTGATILPAKFNNCNNSITETTNKQSKYRSAVIQYKNNTAMIKNRQIQMFKKTTTQY